MGFVESSGARVTVLAKENHQNHGRHLVSIPDELRERAVREVRATGRPVVSAARLPSTRITGGVPWRRPGSPVVRRASTTRCRPRGVSCGRGRGDRAEDLALIAQHGQVSDGLTAVGERHQQVDRDPPGGRASGAWPQLCDAPVKVVLRPVASAKSARSRDPAWLTTPLAPAGTRSLARDPVVRTQKVPSAGTTEAWTRPVAPDQKALSLSRSGFGHHSK